MEENVIQNVIALANSPTEVWFYAGLIPYSKVKQVLIVLMAVVWLA